MMRKLYAIGLILLIGCSGTPEESKPWEGEWQATWETDPASFAGITGITDFTMQGQLTFQEDRVTIQANGFEGCAFGADTLKHTLFWKVRNDSLILTNDEDTPGMDYRINSQTESKVELQLLEDIFLTLEKD